VVIAQSAIWRLRDLGSWFYLLGKPTVLALLFSVSVLVIACPLRPSGLATVPPRIMVAVGQRTENGLPVPFSAESIETAGQAGKTASFSTRPPTLDIAAQPGR